MSIFLEYRFVLYLVRFFRAIFIVFFLLLHAAMNCNLFQRILHFNATIWFRLFLYLSINFFSIFEKDFSEDNTSHYIFFTIFPSYHNRNYFVSL